MVAKQRFREAQDELEELRSLIQDQAAQLEDYRNKYLQVGVVILAIYQLNFIRLNYFRAKQFYKIEINLIKIGPATS